VWGRVWGRVCGRVTRVCNRIKGSHIKGSNPLDSCVSQESCKVTLEKRSCDEEMVRFLTDLRMCWSLSFFSSCDILTMDRLQSFEMSHLMRLFGKFHGRRLRIALDSVRVVHAHAVPRWPSPVAGRDFECPVCNETFDRKLFTTAGYSLHVHSHENLPVAVVPLNLTTHRVASSNHAYQFWELSDSLLR
jgi:hypothetical protein